MQTDVHAVLARWDLIPRQMRERLYQASSPLERWHALSLLGDGGWAAAVSHALDRDPHTIGVWLDALRGDGPAALDPDPQAGL